jgi:tetratricopeptide (TPR) repeat protein
MIISVIVATYNRPDALHLVLQSLETQSDKNFEVALGFLLKAIELRLALKMMPCDVYLRASLCYKSLGNKSERAKLYELRVLEFESHAQWNGITLSAINELFVMYLEAGNYDKAEQWINRYLNFGVPDGVCTLKRLQFVMTVLRREGYHIVADKFQERFEAANQAAAVNEDREG